MTRRPIRDVHGNIVGYSDDKGAGSRKGANVRADANRKPKKPPPPPHYDVTTDANRNPPPTPAPARGPNPAVVRRQRLLRAAGYGVKVDGVWGPSSQTAWQRYQRGQRAADAAEVRRQLERTFKAAERERNKALQKVALQAAPLHQEGLNQLHVDESRKALEKRLHSTDSREMGAAQDWTVRADRIAARAAVQKEIRQTRKLAAAARLKPAENLSLDELVSLTVDPVSGELNPQHPADVKRVQKWLRAHGHPKLTVDGTFGRETFNALRSSYFRERNRRDYEAKSALVEKLDQAHALHPGVPLWGVGPDAKPGEILRILHKGGFTADQLWISLLRLSRNSGLEYLTWREKTAHKLERQAFGPFASRIFPTDPLQALRSVQLIIGAEEARRPGAQRGYRDPDVQRLAEQGLIPKLPPGAERPGPRSAAIGAIETSTSFSQLKREFRKIQRQEDALLAAQAKAAQQHHWWATALDVAEAPGVILRDGTTAFGNLLYATRDITGRSVPTTTLPEQYEAAHVANEVFYKNHFWWGLAYQMVWDPLNLAPGAGTIGRVGTSAALRMERLGLAIDRGERLVALSRLKPLSKAGLGLTLPARSGRLVAAETRGIVDYYVPDALQDVGRKLVRLKTEAISIARQRVNVAMAHRFAARELSGTGITVDDFKLTPKLRERLAASGPDFDAHVSRWLARLFEMLDREGISLYVDEARTELSNVGAMILANVAEVFRAHEVELLAVREGGAARERVLMETLHDAEQSVPGYIRAQAKEASTKAYQDVWNETKDLAAAEAASSREYERVAGYHTADEGAGRDAFRAAYIDIKKRAGTYLRGLPDDQLGPTLERGVRQKLSEFEYSHLPSLQTRLVDAAEKRGISLFDDAGRWVGRQGTAANVLRKLGAEAFNSDRLIDIPNPNAGRAFTVEQANDLIDREIQRRGGLKKAYAIRERAAGRPKPKGWLEDEISKIEDEVHKAWNRGPNGWVDNRATLQVPEIYARHVNALYGEAARGAHPILLPSDVPEESLGVLAQLVEAPAHAFGGDLQAEFNNLAWAMSDGLDELESLAGDFLQALRPQDFDGDAAKAFRGVAGEHNSALRLAYSEALPQALRKEWALWQAMAEAQTWYMRGLYRGLQGFLGLWIFATLPLRPGWVVRNVVDNTAKTLMAGVRDPRLLWLGAAKPGAGLRSVFEADLKMVREAAAMLDRQFGTNAAAYFDKILESFWQMSGDVLGRIFRLHDIPVPEAVLEGSLHDPTVTGRVAKPAFLQEAVDEETANIFARFKDGVWELMAKRPESYSKRMLYRGVYDDVLRETGDELQAFREGWKAVEKNLFDYSKVSVLEDNLRFIFPFAQFWRKNTVLWASHFVNKPWLPYNLARMEEALRDGLHGDLPEWTRRYVTAQELGDGIAHIPGFKWLGNYVADQQVMYDPMNFFSFAPLYRTFKGENPTLPGDKAGLPFISPMVDAMNDWGLSMNPLIRKPLELAGVFNFRAWQSIFPETALGEAFTRKYLHERFPNGLNIEAWLEDKVLVDLMGQDGAQQKLADNFNEYVQMEMANQRLRGEPVSREAAEEKLRNFFYVQSIFSFFTGAYVRRTTPQDFQLQEMLQSMREGKVDFLNLTRREQEAYKLFKYRKHDAVEFDRYVSLIPVLRAFYAQPTFETRERFKREHPEILPWVEPLWSGKGLNAKYVQTAALVQDTQYLQQIADLADDLDLPQDVRAAARAAFVTPELRAFWRHSRTPQKEQDRHLRGLYFGYVRKLNDLFFAIPHDDFDAKQSFLEMHPILRHFWQQNNDAADDYLAIINDANASLRDVYFEHVEAGDWDSAHRFLQQYPFIFEFTKAADRVDDDGNWIGKSGGNSQHARDYLAAKASLDLYFGLPKAQRSEWLNGGSAAAATVRAYFAKYGSRRRSRGHGRTEHARDYLKVKPLLDKFFGMKDDFRQQAWLEHDGPEQKAVLAYFRKWGSKDGNTQHARDYQHAKAALDHYFKLPKDGRSKWLHSDHKLAKIALDYFKKWGRLNRMARAWAKKPESKNPELNLRIQFWHHYFNLPPSERPGYVLREAERHGIFVYGPLSEQELHDRESRYLRKLYGYGVSRKAAMYLYARPLLDEFSKLTAKEDKRLFLAANPELGEYLDEFAHGSASGNPKLDKLIESYFQLDDRSPERSAFLRAHPEVQHYFDAHSSPAEAAMRRLLQVYFATPPAQRKQFLWQHPEIRGYFDKRRLERHAQQDQLEIFAEVDPRLRRFWQLALADIIAPGEAIGQREYEHRAAKYRAEGLGRRVDRRT